MELIGTDTVDLGWGSSMTRLPAKVTQSTERTASGKPYTQSWSWYTGAGWKFTWEYMPMTTFAELELFYLYDAEGSRNQFSILLDSGQTVERCIFAPGSVIGCGKSSVRGLETGPVECWESVEITIEQLQS